MVRRNRPCGLSLRGAHGLDAGKRQAQILSANLPPGSLEASHDGVAQLAHISREGVPVQHLKRIAGQALVLALLPVQLLQQARRDEVHILTPLAQRRQIQTEGTDAHDQVFTELALGGQLPQIAIGGADDARIGEVHLPASHALEFAAFQETQQFGLYGQGKIPDLVQENAALPCQLHQTLAILVRSREGPLHMPKKRALEEGLGNGRTIHRHKGRRAPWTGFMQGPGHQLFSRARLAQYQHRQIRSGQGLNIVQDAPHGCRHGHNAVLGDKGLHQAEIIPFPLLGQLQDFLATFTHPGILLLQTLRLFQSLGGQSARLLGQAIRQAQTGQIGQDEGQVARQLKATGTILGFVKE